MTTWTLISRSLRFYWRGHLGVAAGVAVGAAVLVGALVVGDSVRGSLKAVASRRLGNITLAAGTDERFFRSDLAAELSSEMSATVAPVLMLNGTAVNPDGGNRANQVRVLGVDRRFWRLGGADVRAGDKSTGGVVLNEPLAKRLDVRAGQTVVLRVRRPGLLPADAPMSLAKAHPVALRLTVRAIASESDFGRFSLRADQVAPFNAFVPLSVLQEATDRHGKANMLLLGGDKGAEIITESADAALHRHWKPADADLELRELPDSGVVEIRTGRVFLEHPVERAAAKAFPEAIGILTYFVTEIRCGERKTPYSMVSAVGPLSDSKQAPRPTERSPWAWLDGMTDDAIVINEWLKDDLRAKVGDEIELEYFVIGPMRRFRTRTKRFRVRRIAPMTGPTVDRELMPEFPGVTGVKNCKDWKPGIHFDPRKVRKTDEDYWDRYGGAPKAFVTLRAGKRMWSNRFGGLTAIRLPPTKGAAGASESLRREIDPASVGLFFRPVRAQAVASGEKALDFGTLFLGLSFFLIAAAVLLVGLLFVFGMEQRAEQVGALLAVGFRPRQVRRMLLIEGCAVALAGGLAGSFAGLGYTKAVLLGLGTVWTGAMSESATIGFHVEPLTVAVGGLSAVLIAVAAMWATLWRLFKAPGRELLSGGDVSPSSLSPRSGKMSLWFGLFAMGAAAAVLVAAGAGADRKATAAFFAAGTALLAGGLAFSYALISTWSKPANRTRMTLSRLSLSNTGRRVRRSLATVALLACSSFLIIAVGANRRNPAVEADRPSSGTGGFALYGESTLPVLHDLNDAEDARRAYGLTQADLEGAAFVQFRVRDGDDAGCLNLNRPQNPRIMGVRPEQLRGRFTFARTIEKTDEPWLLLERSRDDGAIPAVGDEATIDWALGKSVGDTLDYTDERGRSFRIRLVGSLSGSILQGGLLISESNFIERFASESGSRAFLIDAPDGRIKPLIRTLTRTFGDAGLELTPAAERLADFYAVRNTYLSIFQALGGLGLLLGSAGLAVVVLRNVLERRSELALLRAVGFTRRGIYRLILYEHWSVLLMGLVCGSTAGAVAVIPALRSSGGAVPYLSLSVTLAAVTAGGILWICLATAAAVGGPMLSALRGE